MFFKKRKPENFTGKVLNGAVIGYGGMGHYHSGQMGKLPYLKFIGGYDIDAKKMDELSSKGVKAYKSSDELFADPDVDFVVISTPNEVHASYAIAAAKAGKHVVCEKPVAMNAKELTDMIKAHEESGTKLMVHQNRRWDSDFMTAKNIYDKSTLGRIYYIESRISGSNGIAEDWRSVRFHGGGMLYDWGIHMIDQVMFMVKSRLIGVYCNLSYVQKYDADDGFSLILYWEDGTRAMLDFDTNDFAGTKRWRPFGEEGTAAYNWASMGKMIKVIDKKDSNIRAVQIGNGMTKTIAPRSRKSQRKIKIEKVRGGWDSFYNQYYGYVVNNSEPYIKTAENLRVMKVIDAAFQSHEKQQRIEVDI